MVLIQSKPTALSIPSICPECGEKLHHVNALDTKAKVYMVFCRNSKCKYCQDWNKKTTVKGIIRYRMYNKISGYMSLKLIIDIIQKFKVVSNCL